MELSRRVEKKTKPIFKSSRSRVVYLSNPISKRQNPFTVPIGSDTFGPNRGVNSQLFSSVVLVLHCWSLSRSPPSLSLSLLSRPLSPTPSSLSLSLLSRPRSLSLSLPLSLSSLSQFHFYLLSGSSLPIQQKRGETTRWNRVGVLRRRRSLSSKVCVRGLCICPSLSPSVFLAIAIVNATGGCPWTRTNRLIQQLLKLSILIIKIQSASLLPPPLISLSLSLTPQLSILIFLLQVQEYQLLRPGSVTPVLLDKCILNHVDFVAKKSQVDDAPEELFFAEVIFPEGTLDSCVRLCLSLGPRDFISGDRLNGCYYCREYNNVWHPEGGRFVRGADLLYKTVEDICDPDMLKQVSRAWEPTEESADNASLYATEVVKFMNQTYNKNYVVVKPGFATHVLVTHECSLIHLNFKAKETDPNAPVKSFFAELTLTTTSRVTTGKFYSFKCCLELGPLEMKSGKLTGDKTNGCYFCHKFNKVRHPKAGGFVRGGDSLYKPEKEFLC